MLIRRTTIRFPGSFLSQNVTHRILNSYDRLILRCRKSNKSGFCSYFFFLEQRKKSLLLRLQNSPYFCVFKYGRAVKQKVWNEAENRERDWGETLKIFLSPHTPVRRVRREKKVRIFSVSPQSLSLFSASFQTFCLTARPYLNTQKYGLFCSLGAVMSLSLGYLGF